MARRIYLFVIVGAASACTSIAGLDGEYVVGESAGDGSTDAATATGPGSGGGTTNAGVGGAGGATGQGGGIGGGVTSAGGSGGAPPTPCGNGVVDSGEECDDGGVASGDGCSMICEVECSLPDSAKHPTTHHCYHFNNAGLLEWDPARTLCQALGNGWDLAVITSGGERNFVDDTLALPEGTNFANDDPFQYWLGGRDLSQQDQFEWINGENWSFAPWDTNPQDPSHGNQDCVRLRAIAGQSNDVFRDAVCNLTSSVLCELQPAGTMP